MQNFDVRACFYRLVKPGGRRMDAVIAGLVIACSALTACNGSGEAHSSTTSSAPSPTVSPTWTPPPPGHWTMKDLQVGRQVPPHELAKLMPPTEVPDEPENLQQATEAAARDATIYFATLSEVSAQQRSSELIESIDWEYCNNCSALISAINNDDAPATLVFREQPQITIHEIKLRAADYPTYVSRVDHTSEHLVVVDKTTHEVQRILSNEVVTLYFGVVYYDGRWQPLYLNLGEEPENA